MHRRLLLHQVVLHLLQDIKVQLAVLFLLHQVCLKYNQEVVPQVLRHQECQDLHKVFLRLLVQVLLLWAFLRLLEYLSHQGELSLNSKTCQLKTVGQRKKS